MSYILIFGIIFSGVWTLLGVIFLIIGLVMLNNRKRKKSNCTSVTYGKVIDIVKNRRYNGHGVYYTSWNPVFEYNIGELKFIKESYYGNSQSKYAIGQKVEVYYNPEDYNEYYIAGDNLPKTLATIFTIVGIVAIIVAIISAILVLYINSKVLL